MTYQEGNVTISRIKLGFVMIGLSIFLLLISGSLNDPEMQMSVAGSAFLDNCILIAALALIAVGIYFGFFSKPCTVCGEQLSPTADDCHHCGHNFDTAPPFASLEVASSTIAFSKLV